MRKITHPELTPDRLAKSNSKKKRKLLASFQRMELLESRQMLSATINLSTGLDASNTLITAGGTPDAHWTVDEVSGAPQAAQVTTPTDPVWYTGTPWLHNGNGVSGDGLVSDWITRDANNVHSGFAPFTFYRFFTLSAADMATATINGAFTIDDEGPVSLNGHALASSSIDQWTALTPFSVPAGSPDFVVGLNELTITMTFDDNYIDGVRLEGTLSGIAGGEVLPPPGPSLNWDPGHISSGAGSGGTGIWNNLDNNWYSSSSNAETLYVSDSTAVFGGSAGTVSVAGPTSTSGLTFNTDGYILSGDTLNLLNGNTIAVNTGTTTINDVLSGTLGLTKTGPGTLILTGANNYTGTTVINNGTLSLDNSGSAAASSSFTVNPGTVFLVQTNTGGASNRLGHTAAINLNSSTLEFFIGNGNNSSESIGALNLGTGLSYYVTDPQAASVTTLTLSSLVPSTGSTFNVNASALGNNSFPSAHIAITNTPSGLLGGGAAGGNNVVNESILPYIAYDGANTVNGTYFGWVSYQGGQLVPLVNGNNQVFQYNQNINSGTVSQDNVFLNNSKAVNAATTINSLILGSSGGDISGTGAITLGSGALMYQRNASMSNAIVFPGGVTGYLYVAGASTTPTIASAFSGNSGLVITGENTTSPITLTGVSNYTGTTYINNARVVDSAPANFGNSNWIVLNNNGVLAPTGNNFLSGTQDLTLNPGSFLNAPGLSTPVHNLTFNAASLGISLDDNTQLNVGGTVQLNGATLNLVLPSAPVTGTHYTLVSNLGGSAIGGTFAGLAEGATVQAKFGGNTYSFKISYVGGSGHDVVLTALAGVVQPPAIGSLSASPSPVTIGTNITLTANNVTDASGTVSSVSFYRETNGTPGLQTGAGGDLLISSDTTSPYTASVPTGALAAGTYTFYAQAIDNLSDLSNVASTTDQVQSNAVPTTVVVDDTAASLTGSWVSSTATSGFVGSDYLHDGNTGKGTKTATFTPTLTAAGQYQVFARWPANSNRATNVPITINSASGPTTVMVNQQLNNNTYVSLGTFNFNLSGGNVVISNTGTNGYVIADAVEFVPVPTGTVTMSVTGPGVTVTGAWTPSNSIPGAIGSNYLHDGDTGQGTKSVTFTPTLPGAGNYQVYAHWEASSNRATNVPITINSAGAPTTVMVNEQNNNATWVLLGTFAFNASGGSVVISNTGANGYVIADGVRFVQV